MASIRAVLLKNICISPLSQLPPLVGCVPWSVECPAMTHSESLVRLIAQPVPMVLRTKRAQQCCNAIGQPNAQQRGDVRIRRPMPVNIRGDDPEVMSDWKISHIGHLCLVIPQRGENQHQAKKKAHGPGILRPVVEVDVPRDQRADATDQHEP
jgi:hypothetical protein